MQATESSPLESVSREIYVAPGEALESLDKIEALDIGVFLELDETAIPQILALRHRFRERQDG